MMVSGYNTSGIIIFDTLTVSTGKSRSVSLYVIDQILGNTWNFGVSNGAGIVGMGVNSPFLKQFIDPQT
jgi:hypothetical protein